MFHPRSRSEKVIPSKQTNRSSLNGLIGRHRWMVSSRRGHSNVEPCGKSGENLCGSRVTHLPPLCPHPPCTSGRLPAAGVRTRQGQSLQAQTVRPGHASRGSRDRPTRGDHPSPPAPERTAFSVVWDERYGWRTAASRRHAITRDAVPFSESGAARYLAVGITPPPAALIAQGLSDNDLVVGCGELASSIAEDSVFRPVSESVGDQQARDCRAEMTAPERLRAPDGQLPARAAGRRNTWWQKRNSGWPLASPS